MVDSSRPIHHCNIKLERKRVGSRGYIIYYSTSIILRPETGGPCVMCGYGWGMNYNDALILWGAHHLEEE